MATVYEIVTEQILKKLESGVVPWRKPWIAGGAVNWKSQREYTGINQMLLEPGEYATFQQIQEAGGRIIKGQAGHIVVFWKWPADHDSAGNYIPKDDRPAPYVRYYKVWNIKQCEGLESRRKELPGLENDPIEAAEAIKEGYRDCPPITFAPGSAYYQPMTDRISVPALTDYHKPEEYYSTLFHEMTHSTGHHSRLNRSGVSLAAAAFGSETYSKEELIAEIGAAMLCGVCGIVQATLDNSASYIAGWHRKLKSEPRLIFLAAGAAQKAADYIQGIRRQGEPTE